MSTLRSSASAYSNGGGGTLILAPARHTNGASSKHPYVASQHSYGASQHSLSASRYSMGGSKQSISGSLHGSVRSLHGSTIILEPISAGPIATHNTQPLRKYYISGSTTGRSVGGGSTIVAAASKPRVSADMAISNFNIVFDKSIALFHPGESIKGKVILDVWTPLDILYIEFKIQGYATIRQFNDSGDGFTGQPLQEYYVNKRILLLSPQPGRNSLSLQQGKYVSEFSYKLPHDIPPSVSQFDLGNGYVFDISYTAKANVCDIMQTKGSTKGGGPAVNRVVKATKATFAVALKQDKDTRNEPIVHSEQIQLFCSPFNADPTSVLVQLNKAVFCVGEYIKIHIELITPSKKRIKKLVAELEQTVSINSGTGKKKTTRFHQTLIKAVDDGSDRRVVPKEQELPYHDPNSKVDLIKTGFRLPIPPNFMPSILPGCELITNSYCIKVTVKFRRFGGELIERIPINIAPPVETAEPPSNPKHQIPLFNKPIMQFPYFAKDSSAAAGVRDSVRSHSTDSLDVDQTQGHHRRGTKYERVSTQYKTGLRCCGCCLLCLGYGIYD